MPNDNPDETNAADSDGSGTEGSEVGEQVTPDVETESASSHDIRLGADAMGIAAILEDDYSAAAMGAILQGNPDKASEFSQMAEAQAYEPVPTDTRSSWLSKRTMIVGGTVATGLVLVGALWFTQSSGESQEASAESPVATVNETSEELPDGGLSSAELAAAEIAAEELAAEELAAQELAEPVTDPAPTEDEVDINVPVPGSGDDEQGDNGSSRSSTGGSEATQAGSDLERVEYFGGRSGTHQLRIQTFGNSQAVAESPETQWFDLIIIISGPDGEFVFNLTWSGARGPGEYQIRSVNVDGARLNPNDVSIDAGWSDDGALSVSISGDDLPTDSDSMTVELGVRVDDGSDFFDSASFIVSGT